MADANQAWRVDDGIRVARTTRDLDYIVEQPCQTYGECYPVRRHVAQPIKLDECITDIHMAYRIAEDHGAEICCLKISNLRGLSKVREVRDYLVDKRIPLVSEDTSGREITTAVVAHFAASTPAEFLVNSTDLHNYKPRHTGIPAPRTGDGELYASDTFGFGVEPGYNSPGSPVTTYGSQTS